MSFRLAVLAVSLSVSALAFPCQAQSGKKMTVGLRIGANFSQLNTLEFQAPRLMQNGMPVLSGGQVVYDFFQSNNSRTTGIVGGVFVRLGNKVFLQPELLLSSKGGTFDLVQTGLMTQQVNVKFTTFDIPLLVGFRLGPLRFNAGPIASVTVSENNSLKEAFKQYTTQSIDKTAKQAVFGYQAGGGLSLLGLQLDLRYEGNLSDFSSVGFKTPNNDARFVGKTSLWQITAGFAF